MWDTCSHTLTNVRSVRVVVGKKKEIKKLSRVKGRSTRGGCNLGISSQTSDK